MSKNIVEIGHHIDAEEDKKFVKGYLGASDVILSTTESVEERLASLDLGTIVHKLEALLSAIESNNISDVEDTINTLMESILNLEALMNLGIIDVLGKKNHAPSPTGSLMGRTTEMLNRVTTLLDRLTAARSNLLDNLSNVNLNLNTVLGAVNATGGTATAGGANAKLNALIGLLTAARAGNLDNLNQNLSATLGAVNATGGTATAGGANAKLNALLTQISADGARSRVRVQRGVQVLPASGDVDITITPVVLNRSFLVITNLITGSHDSMIPAFSLGVSLANASTVRIHRNWGGTSHLSLRWQVIEYL